MSHLEIKREKQPVRCEVCHQTDQFNTYLNKCLRCNDIQSISHRNNLEITIINEIIPNQNNKELQSQDYVLLYQRRKNEASILSVSIIFIGLGILYIISQLKPLPNNIFELLFTLFVMLLLFTLLLTLLTSSKILLLSGGRFLWGILFDKCPNCNKSNPILKDSKNCQYCFIRLKNH